VSPENELGVCLLATLVTRAAKHLLVLLLAHALATLLDQGTHGLPNLPSGNGKTKIRYRDSHIPGSFNWQDSWFWSS
jgi:hypothetical protein